MAGRDFIFIFIFRMIFDLCKKMPLKLFGGKKTAYPVSPFTETPKAPTEQEL